MTPQNLMAWVAAINTIIGLGSSLAHVVRLLRDSMSTEDADLVLRQLLDGWSAAKIENDRRILELQQQISGG